ncbi:MAG: ComF family protein [Candidatus Latescibacterota bacterium]|nr:MAG: ComF family protein [Candidatus Latescibacterota bacterium]
MWRAVLDFVYPPLCLVCGGRLRGDERLVCEPCWDRAAEEARFGPVLLPGGRPGGRPEAALYGRSAYAWNESLGQILHRLKYGGFPSLAERLALGLSRVIEDDPVLRAADLLVPVPLTRSRLAERGFNQSLLLARAASRRVGIPVGPEAARRRGPSCSQTKLSPAGRRENVKGCFRPGRPELVRGKNLVIVDDVLTTGATVRELAGVLFEAGAGSIAVATVARALPPCSSPDSSSSPPPPSRSRKRRFRRGTG